MPLRFERETCSRCGGSGQYSYCEMYGTVCFKCHGKREVLTKRAAVAHQWMKEQNLIPASEVQIGMRVKALGMTITVREIGEGCQSWSVVDGVQIENPRHIALKGQEHGMQVTPDTMVQVIKSQEDQAALLARAIEYQNSLTKEGKPRKRVA